MGVKSSHVVFADKTPAKCTFEDIKAEDLLDAVSTLKPRPASNRLLALPGFGMQAIDWAVADLGSAEPSSPRHAVNAVMNARRALSCWVDAYLHGYSFSLCKNRPKDSRDSTDLLIRRGVIDQLSGAVIRRVIERRNAIEHEYEDIKLEDAQDSVELIRLTLLSLIRQCFTIDEKTYYICSPWLLGGNSLSVVSSKTGTEVCFEWKSTSFVLCSFVDRPWLGVVEPDTPKHALVRRCAYSSMPLQVYEQILPQLEQKDPNMGGGTVDPEPIAQAAGLLDG